MVAPLLTMVFALLACAGSLYLSLGLGLKACPLCFYQRTFAFAIVGVIATGLPLFREQACKLNLLVLPLALGGWGVAAFHTYLVSSGKLLCPLGLGGFGSAPLQSLVAFSLILLPILLGILVEAPNECLKPWPLLVGCLMGALGTYGSLAANPSPVVMTVPLEVGQKMLTCQAPYQVQQ